MTLAPADPKEALTVSKSAQNVMISLGGFASEFYFSMMFQASPLMI